MNNKTSNDTVCLRSDHETVFKVTSNSIGACCKMYPGAKFFTTELDDIKNDLTNGIKNSACASCWKYEELGTTSWRLQGNKHYTEKPNKYLIELYFDNTCDSACIYCSASYSSKWQNEIKNTYHEPPPWALPETDEIHGTVQHSTYIFNYISNAAKSRKPTDYYEIILLGGEPLLTTVNKKEILELTVNSFYRYADPSAPLTIIIQTNGNTPKKLIDKFINRMNELKNVYKNLVFNISLSAESTGAIFEFIRYGCSYNTFVENLNKWASIGCDISANLAVNAVSLCSLTSYLQLLAEISKKYNIILDVSVNMVYSLNMSVGILDYTFSHYCDTAIEFVYENADCFYNVNSIVEKLNHIKNTIGTSMTEYNLNTFKKAMTYFKKVRNTSLETVNPELYSYVNEKLTQYATGYI